MNERTILGAPEFAELVGASTLHPNTVREIEREPLAYRAASATLAVRLTVAVQNAIFDKTRAPKGADRAERWEACWAATLRHYEKFRAEEALVPDYYDARSRHPLRLKGKFVCPMCDHFQLRFWRALRSHLMETCIAPSMASHLFEFGSGSGHNLLALQRRFPTAGVFGLDRSASARQLAIKVAGCGYFFDLLDPHKFTVLMNRSSIAMTFGALEQVGGQVNPFLQWLRYQRPALCIHVEPLLELYASDDPFDSLAQRYHTARGYLRGLVPLLHLLRDQGDAEILAERRVRFGDMFNEGYSFIVWRPTP